MITFPNCKINIGLNITESRDDGFHNLETVFYPLPFSDGLEITQDKGSKAGSVVFSHSGLKINGNDENNLCLRAYRLLEKEHKLPAIKMHLHKTIPMGAGLGGGSSDGAFTLKMLNEIFSLGLSQEDLMGYARQLGSDCAFFLENKPTFAYEKGDYFKPTELDLSGYWLVLTKPDIHVNTSEAYAAIKPKQPEKSLQELIKTPVESWQGNIINDFEASMSKKYEPIGRLINLLKDLGGKYVAMSGSGSAVFSILEKEVRVKDKLGASLLWTGYL